MKCFDRYIDNTVGYCDLKRRFRGMAFRVMAMAVLSILLMFMLSLGSCGSSSVDRDLDRPQSLMTEQPDSVGAKYSPEDALSILHSIPESDLKSEATRARYALLRTVAEYKTGQKDLSDSLMDIAVREYGGKSGELSVLTAYYNGVRLMNKGAYRDAIKELLKARDMARSEGDLFREAMCERDLSGIYKETSQITEDLRSAKAAWTLFTKAGYKASADYALCNLGLVYINNVMHDSAISVGKRILKLAEKNPKLQIDADAILGSAYYAKGDYSSAVGSLRRLVNGKYATHEDSVYLAISLIMSGNREAGHALKSKLDASGASSPQKLELDILCSEAGNTSAADMYKQLIHAVDSISIERLKANASISETEYLETKNRLTEESLRSSRLATALFAVAAVLILCIFVSVIIILRIRNAREKESFRNTILELRESLRQVQENTPERNDRKTESSSSPDVLRKLLSRQYEEIETLLIKAEKATPEKFRKKEFLEGLHNLMRLNDSAVSDLEKAFEREYPGILVRFREAEPEADRTTYLIFVMSGLGIKTAVQRIMLGAATDGAVYSRRKRLKRHLLQTPGGEDLADILNG